MEGKSFVAIGKIAIDENFSPEWNIPDLHFIVNRTPGGVYEATNIELILDSAGKSIEEAIKGLLGFTIHYITMVMDKGCGYDELLAKAGSAAMEEYWQEYRKIEFSLARQKKDLSHTIANKVNAAIQAMLLDEIRQQIKNMAADIADAIISKMKVQVVTLAEAA